MIPRWHILLGAIFAGILWFFAPGINKLYLLLLFLASFLIDVDHYLVASKKNKKILLHHALQYFRELKKKQDEDHAKGVRDRGHFYLFHTVEFHILVALLGMFWEGFFYVFIGMAFHSLCDLAYLLYIDRIYKREYFFINWLRTKGRRK